MDAVEEKMKFLMPCLVLGRLGAGCEYLLQDYTNSLRNIALHLALITFSHPLPLQDLLHLVLGLRQDFQLSNPHIYLR